MEGLGGGDAVRNSTSAGRKIFLLSSKCHAGAQVEIAIAARAALISSQDLQGWRGPAFTLELSVVMEGAGWTWARRDARRVQCY